MFGIGTGELLLILVIALIVLGPERMPRVARDVGRVIGELRRTSDELRDELLNADRMVNKTVDVMPTPTMIETAPSPLVEETPATGADGETLFDREMREARERIKAQQTP